MSRSPEKLDRSKGNSRPFQFMLDCQPSNKQRGSRIAALHVEFVAKPEQAHSVHSILPTAIHGAFEGVAGFAGSVVMISNYEARLVTVVTLWAGEERLQRCHENIRWVRALLAPYLDRCLRIQTLAAYVPEAPAQVSQFATEDTEESPEIAEDDAEAICAA